MKTSKKIISSVLAVLIVVSAMAIGGFSASAASLKAPAKLTVTNANHSMILKWSKVSGAKQYQVYKGTKLMETVSKTSTRDYSVSGGQKLSYKVRAVNGTKKSSFSKVTYATRINGTVVTSVENIKTGIEIKWEYRTGATKYIVERKASDDFVEIGRTDDQTLRFVDTTAVPGTDYGYRITSYNETTKSYSVVSLVKHIIRLVPVTGIKAVKAVDPQTRTITVSWTGSTGAASYNVYRQKATDEDFIRVANVTTTTYIDPDIINNPSAYRYYVTAVKDTSESVKSAERVVQTYGITPAYFDDERNYHVPLKFNVNDVYAEGKHLTEYFSYDGNFDVTILEGNDVISISDDYVITAKKAGTAKVKIKVTDSVKNAVDTIIGDDLVKTLTNRDIILEITVE